MKKINVGVIKKNINTYPKTPFNPSIIFPELKNLSYSIKKDNENQIYNSIRELLFSLGFDSKNFGKSNWNPFKNFIKKNDNIIIKPNLVMDNHILGKKGILSMITHSSIIRPIIDYILLATNNQCNITICDVPLQSANWENIIKQNGLKDLINFYQLKKVKINLLDLRYEIAIPNKEGFYYKKIKKIRDPKGYVKVELGKKSYIQDIIKDSKKLEITDYELGSVSKHHNKNKNEYLIPKTILNSDIFINVPKLKTHRKAGVTLSMKNIIGINGDIQ